MKHFTALLLLIFFFYSNNNAQTPFQVSANKRYITKDGKPFFWMGDTAWELFHRLNREEADFYLKKRFEQGFTVIQAVVLAEFNGLRDPNPYGQVPLIKEDPTNPNEEYFKHVDFIIDKAQEHGLTIGLLPTWGDKLFKASWGTGPEIFNSKNARSYGKWLGNRYKAKKNIIWILGGDRNPRNASDVNVWNSMAAGIIEGTGGLNKTMMTYHPQPNQKGASEWFYNEKWLSFNMFQTGHCRNEPIYEKVKASYDRTPIKPVIDGEPIYEDHPVCFNAKDLGVSSAYDVRKAAYLDLFAGAFGHTYGCHDIWQFYSPDKPSVNNPRFYWKEALELPGANQMRHVRRLIEAYPMLDRVPDQSIVREVNLSPQERIQATRGKDYLFVYSAAGKPFTVNLNKITGQILNAYWYNPQDGKTTSIGKIENSGFKEFKCPSSGYGRDWVLVLDDEAKKYNSLTR